jgi:uncharacterized protein
MRIVLDTNVVISCGLKPGGNEARVVAFALRGVYQLCVCDELEAEYREVSQRAKFGKHRQKMAAVVDDVIACALRVEMVDKPDLCRDPDDNIVLGCALSAAAAYLVTGNLSDFPTGLRTPEITNAARFLASVRADREN